MSSQPETPSAATPKRTSRTWTKLFYSGKFYLAMLGLLAPTYVTMAVFNYYPKWETIKYSFYHWDGVMYEAFIGLKNYVDIVNDVVFQQSFELVGILLAANAVKMWPSIFAAVVLHRLKNEKWQYIYRVMFVIPMVIPAVVTLLIWKSFYDPTSGILNSLLRMTGLMSLLDWLDTAMPALAGTLTPIRDVIINTPFGSVWGLLLFGVIVLSLMYCWKNIKRHWMWLGVLALATWGVLGLVHGAILAAIAVVIGYLGTRSFRSQDIVRWVGLIAIFVGIFFVATTMIWTQETEAFRYGQPAWLGNSNLIIPAIIFWGFPWIGIVGVLIYLAGLQNISSDVYEAGELDGVSWWGKFSKIELPLILTQVRINLIFMTIATLNQYALFLLLLGPTGGPGNKGMVPGLYMYQKAFMDNEYGYACALGMVMFVLILAITIFYQKYLKVDK
jgi:ABC-type sugar transport system permease subunit